MERPVSELVYHAYLKAPSLIIAYGKDPENAAVGNITHITPAEFEAELKYFNVVPRNRKQLKPESRLTSLRDLRAGRLESKKRTKKSRLTQPQRAQLELDLQDMLLRDGDVSVADIQPLVFRLLQGAEGCTSQDGYTVEHAARSLLLAVRETEPPFHSAHDPQKLLCKRQLQSSYDDVGSVVGKGGIKRYAASQRIGPGELAAQVCLRCGLKVPEPSPRHLEELMKRA